MKKSLKKIIGTLVLVNIAVVSLAQQTYQQGIGAANLDYAYAVTSLNNSTYICGANGSFTNQASSSLQILKLDDSGNKIWDISIQAGLTPFAVNWSTSITALSTNELLIGGYTDDGTVNGNKDGFVIKLDTNGNVIWSKRYGTIGQDRVFSVLEMHNGDYIVAGYQVVSGSSGTDGLFIIRIDTAGNMIWDKYFSESPTTVGLAFLNGAIITSNDEIVASGFTNTFGAGDYDNFLIKLDANGNTIFYKNYGSSFDNRIYAITALNNEYFLAGKSATATGDKSCVIKIDSSGNNVWTHYYSILGASVNDFRAVTNNGTSIIASGKTDDLGGEATITVINPSTGTVESSATYGGNALDKFYGINANGMAISSVGATTSTDVAPSTNGDMFVVKTSANDLTACSGTAATIIDTIVTYTTTSPVFPAGTSVYTAYNVNVTLITTNFLTNKPCSAIVTSINESMNNTNTFLYPNPANNYITLNINNENRQDVKISIYNSIGQKIKMIIPFKNKTIHDKIDVNTLIQGIYFVEVQVGNQIETKKLIIRK